MDKQEYFTTEELSKYENEDIFDGVDMTGWQFPMPDDTLDASSLSPMSGISLNSPASHNVESKLPVSPRGPPSKKNFPGDLNFAVEINANKTNKNTFLYSHKLNRIYVNMDTNFPVQFNWDHTKMTQQMYVRATVVFWDESQAEKRVESCIQHKHASKMSEMIVNNVLHSSRELGAEGVYYCGVPSLKDSWYSVVVVFKKTASETCSHAYKFGCKNSCSSGINRRSIGIVFTLEDYCGEVLGRQSVGVRVCACPRRDLIKDEDQELPLNANRPKKRVIESVQEPIKKIKLDVINVGEQEIYTLPPLPVVGKITYETGLQVMLNMMLQTSELSKNNSQSNDELNNSIEIFKKAIEEVKKKQ